MWDHEGGLQRVGPNAVGPVDRERHQGVDSMREGLGGGWEWPQGRGEGCRPQVGGFQVGRPQRVGWWASGGVFETMGLRGAPWGVGP